MALGRLLRWVVILYGAVAMLTTLTGAPESFATLWGLVSADTGRFIIGATGLLTLGLIARPDLVRDPREPD